jgi:hypothetical protein
MNEIDLSQAVKEALVALTQEIGQSYSLPSYLKPLLDGEATVIFKVFKHKVQLTAPVPIIEVIETPITEVVKLEEPKAEPEQTEISEKPKRKRRSEV